MISLIVPRGDNLNGKVNKVNDRLRHMCDTRNIKYIDHTELINPEQHLNERKLHLNRYGTIEFAKNFTMFLNNLY